MAGAKGKSTRRGATQAFPKKLYDLVTNEPDSIISWSESGDCFYLHDQQTFIHEVLPKHFRHNHFSSFQRQLNLYGFKRVANGPDVGAYMHHLFRRDQPQLLETIRRTPQWSAAKERRRKLSLSKYQDEKEFNAEKHFQNISKSKRKYSMEHDQKPVDILPRCNVSKKSGFGIFSTFDQSMDSTLSPRYTEPFDKSSFPEHAEHFLPTKDSFNNSFVIPEVSLCEPILDSSELQKMDNAGNDMWWAECLANSFSEPQMVQPPEPMREEWDSKKSKDSALVLEDEPSYPKSLPFLRRDASTSWAVSCLNSDNEPQLPLIDNTSYNNSLSEPLTPSLDELVIINNLSESVNSFDIRNFRKATLTRAISTSSDLGLAEISRCSSVSDLCSNQARRGAENRLRI